MLTNFLIAFVIVIVVCVYQGIKEDKQKKLQAAKDKIFAECFKWEWLGSKLTVLKGCPEVKELLTLRKVEILESHITPEKSHYVAMGSGNVWTGGEIKTGGNLKVTSRGYTDRGEILVRDGSELRVIDSIELTPAMVVKAKNSSVNKYLDGNSFKLKYPGPPIPEWKRRENQAMLDRGILTAEMSEELAKTHATYEKCLEIIEFIKNA